MFLFRGHESHSRSFVKGISWRALGSTRVASGFYTSQAQELVRP